jgi:hypothetical protein
LRIAWMTHACVGWAVVPSTRIWSDLSVGVVDRGEDVLALSGQGDGLDEVHGQDRLGLGA